MKKDYSILLMIIILTIAVVASSCQHEADTNDNRLALKWVNLGETPFFKYKVINLEGLKTTVFTYSTDINYQKGDTVWINQSTMKIDPTDSVAMGAVIIKREEGVYLQKDITRSLQALK